MRTTDYLPQRERMARRNLTTMTPDDLALIATALESYAASLRSMGEKLHEARYTTAASALQTSARKAERMATELNLL